MKLKHLVAHYLLLTLNPDIKIEILLFLYDQGSDKTKNFYYEIRNQSQSNYPYRCVKLMTYIDDQIKLSCLNYIKLSTISFEILIYLTKFQYIPAYQKPHTYIPVIKRLEIDCGRSSYYQPLHDKILYQSQNFSVIPRTLNSHEHRIQTNYLS